MAINNFIKISELNNFPIGVTHSIQPADFFPLVDSSSLTTYKVSVAAFASSSAFSQNMHVSSSLTAISASFASSSRSSSHALIADNVNTKGNQYYFPHWTTNNTPSTNGALDVGSGGNHSPLFVTYSALVSSGVIIIDPQSSLIYSGGTPNPTYRPDYSVGGYWKYYNNTPEGAAYFNGSGLFTAQPIISPTICTDQVKWYFSTGSNPPYQYYRNSFWSGSSRTGFWANITQSTGPTAGGLGAISQSFNGKWIRLASNSYFGGSGVNSLIASHSNAGEMAGGGNFTGRVKITLATTVDGGSNTNQVIDMQIHDGLWGGGITAQVLHSSFYGYDHIRKLRLSIWSGPNALDKPWDDPMFALDIFVDNLTANDWIMSLFCQSYGGLRFNDYPTVDPIPLMNTASGYGHTDPRTATYLEFPAAPGFYSSTGGEAPGIDYTATGRQPYYFQGKRVYITPHRNEVTESAWFGQPNINYKPYSLYVSGTVATQQYYSDAGGVASAGQSGTAVAYDSVTSGWKKWIYKGGILVDSSSAASSPFGDDSAIVDTVPIGTITAWAGGTTIPDNWIECNGAILATSSYWELHQAILNQAATSNYGFTCNSSGTRNINGVYFKVPDLRGRFLRGWDNGAGVDTGRERSSNQGDSAGSHYHAVGIFNPAKPGNDDIYLITRAFNDATTWSGRQVHGESDDNSRYNFNAAISTDGIATSNAYMTSTSDVRPINTAIIYIIKYRGAVNYAGGSDAIAGDVIGTVAASTVARIRGVDVDVTAPTDGQVLTYNAGLSKWKPQVLPAASNFVQLGRTWAVANPGGCLPYGDGANLYIFSYNQHRERSQMTKLNMGTNAVEFVATTSYDNGTDYQWYPYGRFFKVPDVPEAGGSSLTRAYYFTNLGLHVLTPDNTVKIRRFAASTAAYYDLPVSMSFNSTSGSNPTIWSLYGSMGADGDGNWPTVRYRHHTYRAAQNDWVYRESTQLDLRTIQNADELMKFALCYPTTNATQFNLMMWDYNYIKKRYYMMDSATGFLHILSQTTGQMNTDFNGTSITYEKSLAMPIGGANFTDAHYVSDRMIVDYDLTTGEEIGITWVHRGNTNMLGCIGYTAWPEI